MIVQRQMTIAMLTTRAVCAAIGSENWMSAWNVSEKQKKEGLG